jgi:pyocin large subunit-like protein
MNRGHRARWSGLLAFLLLALFACTPSVEDPQDARAPSARGTHVSSSADPHSATSTRDARTSSRSTAGSAQNAGFKSKSHLETHFEKHGAEFGAATAAEYLALAKALRDAPASSDVREIVRHDGVVTRFDKKSGAFIAFEVDGTIRTFFKPNDGEAYFHRQAERDSP